MHSAKATVTGLVCNTLSLVSELKVKVIDFHGSHRLYKYYKIEGFLEKWLKMKSA